MDNRFLKDRLQATETTCDHCLNAILESEQRFEVSGDVWCLECCAKQRGYRVYFPDAPSVLAGTINYSVPHGGFQFTPNLPNRRPSRIYRASPFDTVPAWVGYNALIELNVGPAR